MDYRRYLNNWQRVDNNLDEFIKVHYETPSRYRYNDPSEVLEWIKAAINPVYTNDCASVQMDTKEEELIESDLSLDSLFMKS